MKSTPLISFYLFAAVILSVGSTAHADDPRDDHNGHPGNHPGEHPPIVVDPPHRPNPPPVVIVNPPRYNPPYRPPYYGPPYPPARPVYRDRGEIHCSPNDELSTVTVLGQSLNELAQGDLKDEKGFVAQVAEFNAAESNQAKLATAFAPIHLNASDLPDFIGAKDYGKYITALKENLDMTDAHAALAIEKVSARLKKSLTE